jgi:hypothetical protein
MLSFRSLEGAAGLSGRIGVFFSLYIKRNLSSAKWLTEKPAQA